MPSPGASPECQQVALRVPLLHVSSAGFAALAKDGVAPGAATDDPTARAVENAMEWSPCVYYYAGRAFPSMGGLGIGIGPDVETRNSGCAAPFDTGGVWSSELLIKFPGCEEQSARKNLLRTALIELDVWRNVFALYLERHFPCPVWYWSERPKGLDDHGIFTASNKDWRAWTFEIRLEKAVPVDDFSKWCGHQGTMQGLDSARRASGLFERERWRTLESKCLDLGGSAEYAQLLEDWAKGEAGC